MVGHWDDFVPLSLLQLIHLDFRLIKEFYLMYRRRTLYSNFCLFSYSDLNFGRVRPRLF